MQHSQSQPARLQSILQQSQAVISAFEIGPAGYLQELTEEGVPRSIVFAMADDIAESWTEKNLPKRQRVREMWALEASLCGKEGIPDHEVHEKGSAALVALYQAFSQEYEDMFVENKRACLCGLGFADFAGTLDQFPRVYEVLCEAGRDMMRAALRA